MRVLVYSMLGYTEIDFEEVKVLTKNVHVKMGKNDIPLNLNLALINGGSCELGQSRRAIVPEIKYQSKSRGLQAGLEKSVEKALRNFFIGGDAADLSDPEFQKLAAQTLKIASTLPPEKISMFTMPVVLVNSIKFTDRLGHVKLLDRALFVPTRGVSISVFKREKLEELLSGLEESLKF